MARQKKKRQQRSARQARVAQGQPGRGGETSPNHRVALPAETKDRTAPVGDLAILLGAQKASAFFKRQQENLSRAQTRKSGTEDADTRRQGLYTVLNYNRIPSAVSIMLIDIDKTITGADEKITEEIAWELTDLALQRIFACFITGRDTDWVVKHAFSIFMRDHRFAQARNHLRFYTEAGCLRVWVDEYGKLHAISLPELKGHPLLEKQVRERLAALCYNPVNLQRAEGNKPGPLEEIARDADEQLWFVSRENKPLLEKHIWNPRKEIMGTLEKIRDPDGTVSDFDQRPMIAQVREILRKWGLDGHIEVSDARTAINLTPKVDKQAIGKSYAAGIALWEIAEHQLAQGEEWSEILRRTLCFGDAPVDTEFTAPKLPTDAAAALAKYPPPMAYVGNPGYLPKTKDEPLFHLRKNIVFQATGNASVEKYAGSDQMHWSDPFGPLVFLAVVNWLRARDRFKPF